MMNSKAEYTTGNKLPTNETKEYAYDEVDLYLVCHGIKSHANLVGPYKIHIEHGKFSKNQNDGIERTLLVPSGCDLSPKKDVLQTMIWEYAL